MARRKVNTTKLDIIQCASRKIFTQGYSATTPKQICDELDISTGNLTYYFPTKEHLLEVFAEQLCEYQWMRFTHAADEGTSSLMAICLELTAMAAMCEEDPIAREFYLSIYTSPICLELVRRSDARRAKEVFREFCPDWTDQQFAESETIVSGIEYATLMTTADSAPLEIRIEGALNNILKVYNVPEEIRKMKIDKVLKMDYLQIGRDVLEDFKKHIEQENEKNLEALTGTADAAI